MMQTSPYAGRRLRAHHDRAARRAFAGCTLAVALLLTAAAPPALAGVYKMYSCSVPGKTAGAPSASPWRPLLDGGNTRFFDACSINGGFGLDLNGQQPVMAAGTHAGVELRRPDAGPKSAISIVRYRTWITADLTGAVAFVEVGGSFSPPGGSTPDSAPWISAPLATLNPVVHVLLYCATVQPCRFANTRPLTVRGIETDLHETVLPSGALDGGSLLSGQAQRGSRTVSFTAADQESGVAKAEFLMGSNVVATDNLDSDPAVCPHVDWAACPARHSGQLSVDTSHLADGEYVGALRITDAAGNSRVVRHPTVITVAKALAKAPAATASTTTVSADGSARLTAQFAANARSSHTISFGRATRIRGRLSDAAGKPLANARLVVTEVYDAAAKSRVTHVVTTATGTYSYRPSGRRPTRRIEIRYPGSAGAPAASASRRLRLIVRAASTLRVRLRGVRVSYSGRVTSRPVPRGGKRIFIQGRAAGGVWQRFATRRTDAAGRFSGRYRLRVRRPGVRLQFRVEIPRQAGYPYGPRVGASVARVVR